MKTKLAPLFVWRGLPDLSRIDLISKEWRPAVEFAVRNWLACMVALYAAFFVQLDQPYWAGMTVWILAQPSAGMTLSRSWYRILGTLAGTAVGIVLIALFAQTPELFIVALALWIGVCTLASNLLRNFSAYGTVLAGYTAAIVSLGAYDNPNQVFYIAMARGAATLIGIACSAMAAELFTAHKAQDKVVAQLLAALRTFAMRGAFPVSGTFRDRVALGRPLVDDLIALDVQIDYAASESAEMRIHANLARSLLAHLFGAIAAKRSLEDHLIRNGMRQDQATVSLYDEAMRLFEQAPEEMEKNQWEELEESVEGLRIRLGQHSPEMAESDLAPMISSRVVLDRLEDLLRHFGRAIHDWRGLRGGWKWEPSLSLDFHRDLRAAYINSVRAFLAVLAAGAFWIASAWPSGSFMLIQVTVVATLFSAAPYPDRSGAAFLYGVMLAGVSAFICNFFLLPCGEDFLFFSLALGLFLVPAAMAMLNATTALFATAYSVNFMILLRPANQMAYDVGYFLNNFLATFVGISFGVLAYKLFLPPDSRAARLYVVKRIRLGLRNLARETPIVPASGWQTRMFDRVNRLYQKENPSGTPTDSWHEGGLAALELGDEVLRLRHLLEEGKLSDPISSSLQSALKSFDEIVENPESTRCAIEATNNALLETRPPEIGQPRRAWSRAVGIVNEMEAFFIKHPDFLKTG